MENVMGLIPLIPFIGAILWGAAHMTRNRLFGSATEKLVSVAAPLAVFLSFIISAAYFFKMLGMDAESRSVHEVYFSWVKISGFNANIAFLMDPLSAVMALIVSGISFLIHVYSIGYMKGDEGFSKFFAYLNLFTGMMLVLVLGDNLMLMFVGWEGVGLASYLLIGFWFKDINNAKAGMKAFIVNRVGDFAFIIGMFTMFWVMYDLQIGTSFDWEHINGNAKLIAAYKILGIPAAEFITLMFFIGATGKSAQIPLYVWLPDAMAGPTPVSALIHAATMVTAGIFMIAKMGSLFLMAPVTMTIIAITGALTSFFAATIALTQYDIKKVLAYSTVSQLGYMFLAMGTGAFSAGVFHLMTHAFFKALLFLGSGSVILGMHHDQDMRHMGGLLKKMKITGYTFLIGVLAIAGVFPFAGFFSKDEILYYAFEAGRGHSPALSPVAFLLYPVGMITAAMTAFYMFRQFFMTFTGEFRGTPASHGHHDDHHHHGVSDISKVHESPLVVTIPLIVLAFLSVAGGFLNVPHAMGGNAALHHWLEPMWHGHHLHHDAAAELALAGLSLAVALVSISVSWYFYRVKPELPGLTVNRFKNLHHLLFNKYFIDELYNKTIIKFSLVLSVFISAFDRIVVDGIVNFTAVLVKAFAYFGGWFDTAYVDGAVNGAGSAVMKAGDRVRKIHTGMVFNYLQMILGGVILLGLFMVLIYG